MTALLMFLGLLSLILINVPIAVSLGVVAMVAMVFHSGMDSLLSIVQMPAGIPVATVSIGGARNAGILAARIIGSSDAPVAARLAAFAADLEQQVAQKSRAVGGNQHPVMKGELEGVLPLVKVRAK